MYDSRITNKTISRMSEMTDTTIVELKILTHKPYEHNKTTSIWQYMENDQIQYIYFTYICIQT